MGCRAAHRRLLTKHPIGASRARPSSAPLGQLDHVHWRNANCQHWSRKRPTRCVAREGFLLARIGNDVRQLATGHLWLHRNGMDALTRLRLEDHFDGGSIDPSREDETVANLSG